MSQAPAMPLPRLSHIAKAIAIAIALALGQGQGHDHGHVAGNDTKDHTP